MIEVPDVIEPLEAMRQRVGKGTIFKIAFEDPVDRSKRVTVFWYTEMGALDKRTRWIILMG